jgi:integrase
MASVFKMTVRGKKSKNYYADWKDHDGVRQRKSTGCKDKQAALRIANQWESEAKLIEEGVINREQVKFKEENQKNIQEHIDHFKSKLVSAKRTKLYIDEVITRIKKICESEGFKLISEITLEGVSRYIAKLNQECASAQTMGKYISQMKYFTKWLTESGKLSRDPLISLKKPNPEKDRRLERRMLLGEEWSFMKNHLPSLKTIFKVTPLERLALYETALQTGYRSSELRNLTKGSLQKIGKQSVLVLKACYTKNGKQANQYISEALANILKSLANKRHGKESLFTMPEKSNVPKMLAADMIDLRNIWINESKNSQERKTREASDFLLKENHQGEVADFHSLRHTCGAWLAVSGSHPKVLQTVMRHSTITLTMDRYGHLFPQQEAENVVMLWDTINYQIKTPGGLCTKDLLKVTNEGVA